MEKYSCSLEIDGINTNICISPYSNRLLIIVTQYEKFGSLITATKESHVTELDNHSEVYTTKTIFGTDDVESHVAARFIAENVKIDRPLLLSICLKNYEPKTLKVITKVINQLKNW